MGHYRAVYARPDGSRKVFKLVPGAMITGRVQGPDTVAIKKPVSIPNARFTYERTRPTSPRGWYAVTVPYPGAYTLGNETVTMNAGDSVDVHRIQK